MLKAKEFMDQLQKGNVTEAIKVVNASLHERTVNLIKEEKSTVLESYGFSIKEEKEDKDEKEDKEDDDDDDEKEDDDEAE